MNIEEAKSIQLRGLSPAYGVQPGKTTRGQYLVLFPFP